MNFPECKSYFFIKKKKKDDYNTGDKAKVEGEGIINAGLGGKNEKRGSGSLPEGGDPYTEPRQRSGVQVREGELGGEERGRDFGQGNCPLWEWLSSAAVRAGRAWRGRMAGRAGSVLLRHLDSTREPWEPPQVSEQRSDLDDFWFGKLRVDREEGGMREPG